jgi:cytidylate kinase
MTSYVKESTLEKLIHKQIVSWEQSKKVLEAKSEVPRPFVTISREYGCFATPLSNIITRKLNQYEKTDKWISYDRALLEQIVKDHDITFKLIETIDTVRREELTELMRSMMTDYPPQVTVYNKLVETIRGLAIHGHAVIVGRAGVVITRGMKYGVHVKLVAPLSYRVHNLMQIAGIKDKQEAQKLVEKKDAERHDFLTQYIKFKAYDPTSYDMTINIERITAEETADMITAVLKRKGFIS